MAPKLKTDSQKHVKTMFENGDWSTKINPEKSYFYDNFDVQKLVDDYVGTGYLEKTCTKSTPIKKLLKLLKILELLFQIKMGK
ncbi:hypothetical protein LPAF129_15840 [Ligilactobacillus pabuli]|uniref:Uncharacterized protein n=1 Tax=Ligilactobacillus pabuli TaxID=2886039 RepID=A0ABQ5JJ32_9LACO|nr:hypothetical protein [Ligilactobacillus pabuli]GKS81898.1 hypothetical protein LPAF129_15840 [Ligilactobacillus pabuli]HIW89075.1 hypothetical protein [Candidatus Ligilactobacillus excrementipullorum]